MVIHSLFLYGFAEFCGNHDGGIVSVKPGAVNPSFMIQFVTINTIKNAKIRMTKTQHVIFVVMFFRNNQYLFYCCILKKPQKMANGNDELLNGFLIFLFVFFFFILLGGCCTGGYYYYQKNRACNCNKSCNCKEHFTDTKRLNNYNALYTDKFLYTQPPGDVKAQEYGGSGQGTRGEFLPLQGIGAGIHMRNSTRENRVIDSPFGGVISGQTNMEDKPVSTRWIGFNNFPYSEEESKDWASNSYLLEGANERVCNPGQKCPELPCADWWPRLHKDQDGFCVQGSDSMVDCKGQNRNINTCQGQGGQMFVDYKNQDQWRHVVQQ